MTAPVVIAVDGGGSKTDVVAITLDGEVVARRRGPGSSPDLEGLERSVAVIDELVRSASEGREVIHAGVYLSGLDLPIELERYAEALAGLPWSTSLTVDNDLFALLRAGTNDADAVVVVCGTGINALGRRADGRVERFPALGSISGDWGGGYGLGSEALWHAARAADGRGPQTALVDSVSAVLEVSSIQELIEQLHFGDREYTDLARLSPAVFDAAGDGDEVALSLIARQGTEIVDFVRALVARLDLRDVEFPVVLGGGILRAELPLLHETIVDGIAEIAPLARLEIVRDGPVVGAALLALAEAGASHSAQSRVRESLVSARP